MAINVHLLVDEVHARLIQQVDLIEHDQRLNVQRFAGHEVAVDNIRRKLRQDRGNNDNLIDIGGDGFDAVVEIRTRQYGGPFMDGLDDALDEGQFA